MRNPLTNRAIFVLSFIGLLIAGMLWKLHSNPIDIPCGGSSGCLDVANSPFSHLPVRTGPPIAMYGTLGYLAILVLSVMRTLPSFLSDSRKDNILRVLVLLGAIFGTAFSARLTYMELNPAYIGAICKWCMASQVIILLILGLSLTDVVQAALQRRKGASTTEGIAQ